MKWQLLAALFLLAVMITSCAPQAAPEPAPSEPAPQAPAAEPTAPAEPTETAEAKSPAEMEAAEVEKREVMSGEYIATKEDGVIRGVGCDADSNTVLFELHNPTETDWTFYKKVVPTPPNQIKLVLNGLTLLDLDCDAELLAAGETVKCSKTGSEAEHLIKFRKPETEFVDDLTTVATGGRDELKFRCVPRGDWTPEVEEDYSTRVE